MDILKILKLVCEIIKDVTPILALGAWAIATRSHPWIWFGLAVTYTILFLLTGLDKYYDDGERGA